MIDAASTENRTFESTEALAHDVAEWLCGLARASDRVFAVCLSGGSTPRRLYERLADPAFAARFPWNRAHWFWGDERFVPHDDRDSNYRMARDAFLSRVPVPNDNIHAVPTEGLSPDQAARAYETTLKQFYGAATLVPGRPLFDVTLLGIGEDGHTASLFPGQPTLQETSRWAVAVIGAKAEARITLTYPVLDSSREVAFLVTGKEKRGVVSARPSGRSDASCSRCSPGRASPLVYGSRRRAGRSGLMSVQIPLTEDTSPPSPRVVVVMGVSGCGNSTVILLHSQFEALEEPGEIPSSSRSSRGRARSSRKSCQRRTWSARAQPPKQTSLRSSVLGAWTNP